MDCYEYEKIEFYGFSNLATEEEYWHKNKDDRWIEKQCGCCSFFAPLNAYFGICCYKKARFHTETVFEHFGCEKHCNDGFGWKAHKSVKI